MAFHLGIPLILDEGRKPVEGLLSQCGQHLLPPSQAHLGASAWPRLLPGHLRVEEPWCEFSAPFTPCDLGQVGLSLGASVSYL